MKLPNFLLSSELNSLRERMGISPDQFGDLRIIVDAARLSELELERLTSQDGLDIASIDDVQVLADGTLAYKNSRVLLYIRDHQTYGDRDADPRFHVANCDTLQQMKRNRRFARYVVATRLDGRFKINWITGPHTRTEVRHLAVCQNCLNHLTFDGFYMGMARAARLQKVKAFDIARFFEKFPQNLHSNVPTFDDVTAPLNDYTQDFSQKSNAIREKAGWVCQEPSCRLWLGKSEHRRFLHVHHINGLRSDDSPANLDVLCIGCHADQPQHGHMKSLSEYREFSALRPTLPRVSATSPLRARGAL